MITGSRSLILRCGNKLAILRGISTPVKCISLWTAKNIVKSPHKDIDMPSKTIPEHTWENLEKWSDNIAMVCGITNRSYTYHQLYKYSRTFAANLRKKLNITNGDVVCVMIPNSPEYGLVVLGVLEAGGTVSTINPIYTAYEVERQLIAANAKIIIGVSETIPVLRDALRLAKKDLKIICIKGSSDNIPNETISFEELAFAENVDLSVLKNVNTLPDDIALLPYSSGTTGLPKGVELTHRNIVVNCVQMDVETIRQYDETKKTNQNATLGLLPFYHLYGLAVIMHHKLSVGLKILTMPNFQPNTFINFLKDNPIDVLYAVPPIILFLGSHMGVKKEYLSSIKTFLSAAAPLPRIDIENVLEKLKSNANFINLYGLTETSPVVTAMLPGSNSYSTVGYSISNTELKIANSQVQALGPNEVGELLVRGPQVMKGYRNNPSATKDTITKDGWLKTGDLASIDESGAVTIADRIKELIKVKGYQVPPAELENILKDHKAVMDAAVIGIPDNKGGEVPKAFVVLKDGHTVEANEVKFFVAERVAEYKQVKEILFLEALPKTPSGKILRRVLKEKYS